MGNEIKGVCLCESHRQFVGIIKNFDSNEQELLVFSDSKEIEDFGEHLLCKQMRGRQGVELGIF